MDDRGEFGSAHGFLAVRNKTRKQLWILSFADLKHGSTLMSFAVPPQAYEKPTGLGLWHYSRNSKRYGGQAYGTSDLADVGPVLESDHRRNRNVDNARVVMNDANTIVIHRNGQLLSALHIGERAACIGHAEVILARNGAEAEYDA